MRNKYVENENAKNESAKRNGRVKSAVKKRAKWHRQGGAVFFVILAGVIGSWAHRDYNKLATPAVMSTLAQGKNLTVAQQRAALAPAPSYSFGSLAEPAPISGGTEKASDEPLLMTLINRQLHLPAEAPSEGWREGPERNLAEFPQGYPGPTVSRANSARGGIRENIPMFLTNWFLGQFMPYYGT